MKFIAAALAASMLIASPALAQDNAGFTGARVEVTAGYNDITGAFDANNVVYGAAAGFDLPVGNKLTFGIEANASNVFENERQIGAAARLGYAVTPKALVYVKGGYNNYRNVFHRNLDGFVIGTGLEYKVSNHTYVKVQYDYSDFQGRTGSSAVQAGVGVRF